MFGTRISKTEQDAVARRTHGRRAFLRGAGSACVAGGLGLAGTLAGGGEALAMAIERPAQGG